MKRIENFDKKSHFMWIWNLCFFLVLDWTMHWSYLETTFLVAIIYQIKHLPWIRNLFCYHFCLFPPFFTFYYHILSNIHKNTKLKLQPFLSIIINDVILKFSLLTRIIKSLWNRRTELIFGPKFYFRRSWYVCLVLAISGALDVRLRWYLTGWKAYEILFISSVGLKRKFRRFNGIEWDVSWRRG